MRGAVSLHWLGEVQRHDEAEALMVNPGDAVLVCRGRPRLLVLTCPCGCGANITVNLDLRTGPAWKLYSLRRGISLYPSVRRTTGCCSHFVIWNGTFLMVSDHWEVPQIDDHLGARVLEELQHRSGRHLADLAEALNEEPWSVLTVCRSLVGAGVLQETVDGQVFELPGGCRR